MRNKTSGYLIKGCIKCHRILQFGLGIENCKNYENLHYKKKGVSCVKTFAFQIAIGAMQIKIDALDISKTH